MMTRAVAAFGELLSDAAAGPPWYRSNEVIGAVLGAVLASALTFFVTRGSMRGSLGQRNTLLKNRADTLESERKKAATALHTATTELERLREVAEKYSAVKEKLAASVVIHTYEQPVLLLGARNVGKTSLMMQWHAPWNHNPLVPTDRHKRSTVPVYDVDRPETIPHFADPEVLASVHAHLTLLVHDFPGELRAQTKAIEVAEQETRRLRDEYGVKLGVVLVCMFDAKEAATGIEQSTDQYYNPDLFGELRWMVTQNKIDIQRLVIVFNKFDLLRAELPGTSDKELLSRCEATFGTLIDSFHGTCNPEKVCETVTVLDRGSNITSQGATVVLGEAARGLYEAVVGVAEANRLIGDHRASKTLAMRFPRLP